jgi:hypothetical protein
MTGLDPVSEYGSGKIAVLWALLITAIPWIPGWIAWIYASGTRKQERDRAKAELHRLGLFEEETYQQWFSQRQHDRMALEKERVQTLNLSPKAFAQLVADLPSVLSRVEYFLGLAERQLPKGSPQFFWDTISKLEGMLFEGIPDKVCAIKNHARAGSAVDQVETLERETAGFVERLQSLVGRAKGLETFAQEHALRCTYEKRKLEDLKRELIQPKRSSFILGDFTDGDSGHDGGNGGNGGGGH